MISPLWGAYSVEVPWPSVRKEVNMSRSELPRSTVSTSLLNTAPVEVCRKPYAPLDSAAMAFSSAAMFAFASAVSFAKAAASFLRTAVASAIAAFAALDSAAIAFSNAAMFAFASAVSFAKAAASFFAHCRGLGHRRLRRLPVLLVLRNLFLERDHLCLHLFDGLQDLWNFGFRIRDGLRQGRTSSLTPTHELFVQFLLGFALRSDLLLHHL